MRAARKGLFVIGKTILWWPKLPIPRMLKTLWSPQKNCPSHRCLVMGFSSDKSRFSLDRTFPAGFLVRLSRGKSFAFSARVPIHLGCCLFLSFEVRNEREGKWLALKHKCIVALEFFTELKSKPSLVTVAWHLRIVAQQGLTNGM